MAFKDLREFIDELERRGLLKHITAEVDCELEITEITDRVSKMEREKNVALLFENVKGYDMPVLMEKPNDFKFIYDTEDTVPHKIEAVAREIYGADGVDFTDAAKKSLQEIEALGFDKMPVCMSC